MTTQQLSPKLLTPQTWLWQNHRIIYTVQGEGIPLVLLHGFGGCVGHWRKNIPTLAQAGYQVFALDLLGFGASDKPPLDYSMDLWYSLLQDFWATHIQQSANRITNPYGWRFD